MKHYLLFIIITSSSWLSALHAEQAQTTTFGEILTATKQATFAAQMKELLVQHVTSLAQLNEIHLRLKCEVEWNEDDDYATMQRLWCSRGRIRSDEVSYSGGIQVSHNLTMFDGQIQRNFNIDQQLLTLQESFSVKDRGPNLFVALPFGAELCWDEYVRLDYRPFGLKQLREGNLTTAEAVRQRIQESLTGSTDPECFEQKFDRQFYSRIVSEEVDQDGESVGSEISETIDSIKGFNKWFMEAGNLTQQTYLITDDAANEAVLVATTVYTNPVVHNGVIIFKKWVSTAQDHQSTTEIKELDFNLMQENVTKEFYNFTITVETPDQQRTTIELPNKTK